MDFVRKKGIKKKMRTTFADPRQDFVFKRVFGPEEREDVLVPFLNDLLELEGEHRIVEVWPLPEEQRPKVAEMKYSIVDVRCRDARGVTYVVEMQVLNVEAFEKRVVYNVTKAYAHQLGRGRPYPDLNDVVGVTICDFELWPSAAASAVGSAQRRDVPMLSRWRFIETHSGAEGLSQIQLVFLELPKLDMTRPPRSIVEKWAYFFREAVELKSVPEVLSEPAIVRALEAARAAAFTEEEWDDYIREGIAIQDGHGAVTLAERVGREAGRAAGRAEGEAAGRAAGRNEGKAIGLRTAVTSICEVLGIEVSTGQRATIDAMGSRALEQLLRRLKRTRNLSA